MHEPRQRGNFRRRAADLQNSEAQHLPFLTRLRSTGNSPFCRITSRIEIDRAAEKVAQERRNYVYSNQRSGLAFALVTLALATVFLFGSLILLAAIRLLLAKCRKGNFDEAVRFARLLEKLHFPDAANAIIGVLIDAGRFDEAKQKIEERLALISEPAEEVSSKSGSRKHVL